MDLDKYALGIGFFMLKFLIEEPHYNGGNLEDSRRYAQQISTLAQLLGILLFPFLIYVI